MSNTWYGQSDAEVREHGFVFEQAANLYAATIGFTAAQVTAVEDAYNSYDAAIQNHLIAIEAAKSAREAKEEAKQTLIRNLQKLGQKVKASPAATPQLIIEFGMKPNKQPTKTTPKTPLGLIATGASDGTNVLTWKPNGNVAKTVYIVEANMEGNTGWQQVGAVTATRFEHLNQSPGTFMLYRVVATRRGLSSAWSETASVYGAQASLAA